MTMLSITASITEVLTAVTFARKSRLSETIVKIDEMQTEVAQIQEALNEGYTFPFLNESRGWELLMQTAKTSYELVTNEIHFTITLPICETTIFNVERFLPTPKKVDKDIYKYRSPVADYWIADQQGMLLKGYTIDNYNVVCKKLTNIWIFCNTFGTQDLPLSPTDIFTAVRKVFPNKVKAIPTENDGEFIVVTPTRDQTITVWDGKNLRTHTIAEPSLVTCSFPCTMTVGGTQVQADRHTAGDFLQHEHLSNFTQFMFNATGSNTISREIERTLVQYTRNDPLQGLGRLIEDLPKQQNDSLDDVWELPALHGLHFSLQGVKWVAIVVLVIAYYRARHSSNTNIRAQNIVITPPQQNPNHRRLDIL